MPANMAARASQPVTANVNAHTKLKDAHAAPHPNHRNIAPRILP